MALREAPGDGAAAGLILRTGDRISKSRGRVESAELAELKARDWITEIDPRRERGPRRFAISSAGRSALRRSRAQTGPEETRYQAQHRAIEPKGGRTGAGAVRINLAESPLAWLARRKGPDGAPFLTRSEVEAGERLREDFEAAQMGPKLAQDWRRFLAAVDEGGRRARDLSGSGAADRVRAAMSALGPGLSDVALRVCCFLEGLESVERGEGWAARSGKVVLKIALARLVSHYGLERVAAPRGRIEAWSADPDCG